MFYVKLEDNMKLTITSVEPIYRGDNLNQNIIYLIPKFLKKMETVACYVYLNYVRADGVADVVVLEPMEEEYSIDYWQYTFPVTCRLTKFPGEICTWLQIYTGSGKNPIVAKSGECMLQVRSSKSMDEYLSDHHLTALYQIHSKLDAQLEEVNEELSTKADSLSYVDDEDALQLTSKGEPVGEALPINEVVEDVMVESDMYDVIEFEGVDSYDTPLEDDNPIIEFEESTEDDDSGSGIIEF